MKKLAKQCVIAFACLVLVASTVMLVTGALAAIIPIVLCLIALGGAVSEYLKDKEKDQ